MVIFSDSDIKRIVQQFSIDAFRIVRPKDANLAFVYIINDAYILRGRQFSEDNLADLKREDKVVSKVKNVLPLMFPNYLKTENKKDYMIAEDTIWTVHDIIPGSTIGNWYEFNSISDDLLRWLLKEQRKMHEATKCISKRYNPFFLEQMSKRFVGVKHMFDSEEIRRIEDALSRVRKAIKIDRDNDICFVHGDYHPGNIIVDKSGKLTGLIDLDWCRFGSPLEDLSFTVMMYLRDYKKKIFVLDKLRLFKALDYYGLEKDSYPIFEDYFLLYVMFDLSLFIETKESPGREVYIPYQKLLMHYMLKNRIF